MTASVNVQLTEAQLAWLECEAQRLGQSPEEVTARLLEESLRESKFPHVEFREAYQGHDAFLRGTRIKIWLLANHVRANDGDIVKTAAELDVAEAAVANAMEYAAEYAAEIDAAIAENWVAADELKASMTVPQTSR